MALSPVRLRASMSAGSADTIAFTRSNSPALMASMNARVSGMARFYLALAAATGLSFPLAAQSPQSQERPPLGSSITLDPLGELPPSARPFPPPRARRGGGGGAGRTAAARGRARQHLDADAVPAGRRRHHRSERHRHAAA